MANIYIIKHGNAENQHNWGIYVCPYCQCEFIENWKPLFLCPECYRIVSKENKKAHITDKEAREIIAKNIVMDYLPEE